MTEINKNITKEIIVGPQPKNYQELEKWAEAQLETDEDYASLINELRSIILRKKSQGRNEEGPREKSIRYCIKDIWDNKIKEGSKLFGIIIEDQESEEEIGLRRVIFEKALSDPNASVDEILFKLDMIDEKGRFTFPPNMFSKKTNSLWRKYIDWVGTQKVYVDMDANNEIAFADKLNFKDMDKIRTDKHNDLTRSIMADLGIKDDEENFIFYRRLAAKMRDSALPNTGEIKATASRVYDWIDGIKKDMAE